VLDKIPLLRLIRVSIFSHPGGARKKEVKPELFEQKFPGPQALSTEEVESEGIIPRILFQEDYFKKIISRRLFQEDYFKKIIPRILFQEYYFKKIISRRFDYTFDWAYCMQ
jgi:hypothetical protein